LPGYGRIVRVRKTGEFGRRISPIATSYQPPPRESYGNEATLQTSETRRSDTIFGIKKPSQSLQLPIYTPPDQEAEETGESVQGYAYPAPDSPTSEGYDFNKPPISEFPIDSEEPQQQIYEEDPVRLTYH
jgi:hypothetical protein